MRCAQAILEDTHIANVRKLPDDALAGGSYDESDVYEEAHGAQGDACTGGADVAALRGHDSGHGESLNMRTNDFVLSAVSGCPDGW